MNNVYNPVKLYETVVDECPYLDNRQSASILVDPEHKIDETLFALLSRSGFRRSGDMLYAPKCPSCKACISVRIPSQQFKPTRSQKRVWKRNSGLSVVLEDVRFEQAHFDLYLKYQKARHADSSMCDDDPAKYISFIDSYYSDSKFLCFYLDKTLIGISVIDQFNDGLSAVYTFFDPEQAARSIGTYAILYIIKYARLHNINYVYLGYWIKNSSKMSYKSQFHPLQGYIDKQWVDLTSEDQ